MSDFKKLLSSITPVRPAENTPCVECLRPAEYVVKTRDPEAYPMCLACTYHNVKNRMATIVRELRVSFRNDGRAFVDNLPVGRVGRPDPSGAPHARTPLWTFKASDGKTAEPKRRRSSLSHDILVAYLRITGTKYEHVKLVY